MRVLDINSWKRRKYSLLLFAHKWESRWPNFESRGKFEWDNARSRKWAALFKTESSNQEPNKF